MFSAQSGAVGFTFQFNDVDEIGVRVKYMSVIDFARGLTTASRVVSLICFLLVGCFLYDKAKQALRVEDEDEAGSASAMNNGSADGLERKRSGLASTASAVATSGRSKPANISAAASANYLRLLALASNSFDSASLADPLWTAARRQSVWVHALRLDQADKPAEADLRVLVVLREAASALNQPAAASLPLYTELVRPLLSRLCSLWRKRLDKPGGKLFECCGGASSWPLFLELSSLITRWAEHVAAAEPSAGDAKASANSESSEISSASTDGSSDSSAGSNKNKPRKSTPAERLADLDLIARGCQMRFASLAHQADIQLALALPLLHDSSSSSPRAASAVPTLNAQLIGQHYTSKEAATGKLQLSPTTPPEAFARFSKLVASVSDTALVSVLFHAVDIPLAKWGHVSV